MTSPLPAYLWGIETLLKLFRRDVRVGLPAYLWGIETAQWSLVLSALLGYQPTYEELKPA